MNAILLVDQFLNVVLICVTYQLVRGRKVDTILWLPAMLVLPRMLLLHSPPFGPMATDTIRVDWYTFTTTVACFTIISGIYGYRLLKNGFEALGTARDWMSSAFDLVRQHRQSKERVRTR